VLPLLSLAWRSLASRPLRSALTALAVALGVAMLVAVLVVSATLDASLERAALRLVGHADLEIRSFGTRGFTAASLHQIAAAPEVALAAPTVRKRVFYRYGDHQGFVELIGLAPASARQLGDYAMRAGAFLPDESLHSVMVLATWARARGLHTGDYLELMSYEGLQPFQVVGLLDDAGLGETGYGQVVYVSLQAAQQLFNLGDRAERVAVQLRPGATVAALEARLRDTLQQDYQVVPAVERARVLRESTTALQQSLRPFGLVPLLVGLFFVLHSFLLSIAERVRELALLRIAGATPRQILRLVLAEALLLGALGGVVGTALGVALAAGLARALEAAGELRLLAWRVPPALLLAAPLAGTLATLVASLPAALRAAQVPPLEGLRPAGPRGSVALARPPLRWATAGLTTVALLLAASLLVPAWRGLALGALLLLFASALALTPALLVAMGQLLLRLGRRLPAVVGLSARNLERNRQRAAVTLAALVVSVALTVGIGGLAASAAQIGRERAEALFAGDYAVVSPVAQPAAIAADFAVLPGVGRVSPIARFQALHDREIVDLVALEPDAYIAQPARGPADSAWREALAALAREPAGVILSPELAAAWHTGVGERVVLRAAEHPIELVVVGVVGAVFPSDDDRGAAVIQRATQRAWTGEESWQYLNVLPAEGAAAGFAERLQDAAALYGLQAVSTEQIAAAIQRSLGRVLGLVQALLLVSAIIAALAILNTMLLNVYDRRREIGLLRATGMLPRQVATMVLLEAGSLGLLAALVGGSLGLALGAITLRVAQSPELPAPYVFPGEVLLLVALGALGLVPAICLYPARRAASLNIVQALSHEH